MQHVAATGRARRPAHGRERLGAAADDEVPVDEDFEAGNRTLVERGDTGVLAVVRQAVGFLDMRFARAGAERRNSTRAPDKLNDVSGERRRLF